MLIPILLSVSLLLILVFALLPYLYAQRIRAEALARLAKFDREIRENAAKADSRERTCGYVWLALGVLRLGALLVVVGAGFLKLLPEETDARFLVLDLLAGSVWTAFGVAVLFRVRYAIQMGSLAVTLVLLPMFGVALMINHEPNFITILAQMLMPGIAFVTAILWFQTSILARAVKDFDNDSSRHLQIAEDRSSIVQEPSFTHQSEETNFVRFTHECGARLKFQKQHLGRSVFCQSCGKKFQLTLPNE